MISFLRAAVDRGVTLFDTAEVYGPSTTRSSSARPCARPRRRRHRHQVRLRLRRERQPDRRDQQPDHIRPAVDGSLRRLGPTPSTCSTSTASTRTSPSRTSPAPSRSSIEAGKVRHFGMSEAGVGTIRRAHAVQPVTALQSEYSLFWREPEDEILPALEELGIGFVPFSPLGRGLPDRAGDRRHPVRRGRHPRHPPPLRARGPRGQPRPRRPLTKVAERKNATVGQVALAWLLAQQPWIVPIPGTRRLERLDENLGSADLDLTPEDLAELDERISQRAGPGRPLPRSHATDDRPLSPRRRKRFRALARAVAAR